MKTNKSYTKRLRVTKTGKIIGRKSGQNHFNAKESGKTRMHKKNSTHLVLKNKIKSRYLINA